jgi:small-conductance mechanosensitive channel
MIGRLGGVFVCIAGLALTTAAARAVDMADVVAPADAMVEASDSSEAGTTAAPVEAVTDGDAATSPPAHGAEASPAIVPPAPGAIVHLRDNNVFTVRAPRGLLSTDARAKAAGEALEHLLEERELPEVRVEEKEDHVVVYGGTMPIVQLYESDAALAGDASLSVHAASVAAKVREALRSEHQRKAVAETVFAISLFGFSALIAVLLLGKVRELVARTKGWVEDHPDRLPALRIQGIDLVRPAAVRGALTVALRLGGILSLLGIAYGWVLFASSLFESTRTYTERLTGFVLAPLSALIGRVGSALPLLVIALSALLTTVLLVRFVGLFFGSVARGETTLGWLPYDLAVPTGALVRLGIVIVALLVAAPLVTGNDDGALARAGIAALVAVGFASSPILASIAAGVPAIYGRKVRVGDYAEVGGKSGRVLSVSLLEVRMEDGEGCEIRVPHLLSLVHPTRVMGPGPVASVEIVVDPLAPQAHVREALVGAARGFGFFHRVDLVRLDAEGAHYRVVARVSASVRDRDLGTAIADALAREGIELGRSPGRHG